MKIYCITAEVEKISSSEDEFTWEAAGLEIIFRLSGWCKWEHVGNAQLAVATM